MGGRGKVIEKSTNKKEAGRRMANTEPRAQVISNDATTTYPVSVRREQCQGFFAHLIFSGGDEQ